MEVEELAGVVEVHQGVEVGSAIAVDEEAAGVEGAEAALVVEEEVGEERGPILLSPAEEVDLGERANKTALEYLEFLEYERGRYLCSVIMNPIPPFSFWKILQRCS